MSQEDRGRMVRVGDAFVHSSAGVYGDVRLAHVPAKWIRFADKDMRQLWNLRRLPVILDHSVIQYDRKAL
jgi:hypothetical protein